MNNRNLSTYIWWSIAIALVIGYAINFAKGLSGFDWVIFYYPQARQVSAERLINPLWVYFVLGPISRLPLLVSYILFLLLNTVMLWTGSRLAGGQRFLLLLSFPAFWVLWFGQLDGFVLLGTALGLKALNSEDPISMGLAILLLLIKPHIGGPLAALYFLWSRKRETVLVIMVIVLLSMVVWGWDWPFVWLQNLITIREGDYEFQTTNISLYPYGLLTWLLLLVRMPKPEKVKIALSATLLSVPYAATYSILALLVLPLPWWVYALSSAPFIFGSNGYKITTLAPLMVILWVLCSHYRSVRQVL